MLSRAHLRKPSYSLHYVESIIKYFHYFRLMQAFVNHQQNYEVRPHQLLQPPARVVTLPEELCLRSLQPHKVTLAAHQPRVLRVAQRDHIKVPKFHPLPPKNPKPVYIWWDNLMDGIYLKSLIASLMLQKMKMLFFDKLMGTTWDLG